jgi:hypothetical protein
MKPGLVLQHPGKRRPPGIMHRLAQPGPGQPPCACARATCTRALARFTLPSCLRDSDRCARRGVIRRKLERMEEITRDVRADFRAELVFYSASRQHLDTGRPDRHPVRLRRYAARRPRGHGAADHDGARAVLREAAGLAYASARSFVTRLLR